MSTQPAKKSGVTMAQGVGLVAFGLIVLGALQSMVAPRQAPSPSPTVAVISTTTPTAAVTQAPNTPTAAPTQAARTPAPTPVPAPTAPPKFTFGAGKKIVGTDVQAGTYRTRAPSAACYWERLSGLGGTFGEIIANANTNGPAVVTILATDKGFNSTRCSQWTEDLSAITSSPIVAFGEGTFIVGVDIAAGTWRSSLGQGCYWQRQSGFTGDFSEIIANENPSGPGLVTIAASDKGFFSARCGTWTKLG